MAHHRGARACGRWVLDTLTPGPRARVLEIGYGPGVTLAETCRRVPDGQMAGVDSSPLMRRQAARRTARFATTGLLDLRHGDTIDLDPDLREFDLIYGIDIWQHWPDPDRIIADLATRLRAAGQLSLAHTRASPSTLTPGAAAKRLAEAFAATQLVHIGTEWMPRTPAAILVTGHRPAIT
ncbi:class I SAM-dependent methyltransferase [Nocardia mexicana]|uniref:Methyltransferase family protein n=1 Tax=Nocardia mexicana TaxID=279262 RepID=A0A370GND2_9NOCA|nr:methyltransferase domain-containing protein [Nocardia mexicana]RDI45238.1 methyltransferase family protein [Nocardia mexicana]